MNKINDFVKKRHSLTILDIGQFLLNLTIVYVIFTGGLLLSKWFDLQPNQTFTDKQWRIILLGSLPFVFFTYFREMYITSKKERQIKERKIIYDCIGGAIEQLIEIKSRSLEVRIHYITELLKYMEKVVFLILKEYGTSTGEICANLMMIKENPLRLELMYFGTFLSGRKKITIPVVADVLVPGAPEAYSFHKTTYINNTMSDEFRKFFDENKPYRCIISIPISDTEGHIFAILNIDSDVPDQFVAKDFIDQKIIPTINPLLLLLKLEKDLILNTDSHIGDK